MDALRASERPFKRALSGVLGLLAGSRPVILAPGTRFGKILVVRQHNQLGDMLCVIPFLRQLKASYPEAAISLLASPVNAGVMVNNRYLDEVILYDKTRFLKNGRLHLLKFRRFVKELQARQFDLAVVPGTVSTSFTSDLLAYLSGAKTRVGVRSLDGRTNPSAFFFNVPRDLDWRGSPGRHQTLRNADIMEGIIAPPVDLRCELHLTAGELAQGKDWVSSRMQGGGKAIAFHPGAGKPPNRWPAERFAALAKDLTRVYGARIFVTEGPMDGEVTQMLRSALDVPFELIQNKAIRDVASILFYMDLVVSNDTGIMHVAAAAGVPVVSLFGPTDPRQWAPNGPRNRWIRSREEDISAIETEEVLRACHERLGGPPS